MINSSHFISFHLSLYVISSYLQITYRYCISISSMFYKLTIKFTRPPRQSSPTSALAGLGRPRHFSILHFYSSPHQFVSSILFYNSQRNWTLTFQFTVNTLPFLLQSLRHSFQLSTFSIFKSFANFHFSLFSLLRLFILGPSGLGPLASFVMSPRRIPPSALRASGPWQSFNRLLPRPCGPRALGGFTLKIFICFSFSYQLTTSTSTPSPRGSTKCFEYTP